MTNEEAKAHYDGKTMQIGRQEWSISFLGFEGDFQSPHYRVCCNFIGPDSRLNDVEVDVRMPEIYPPQWVIQAIQTAIERGQVSSNGRLVIADE